MKRLIAITFMISAVLSSCHRHSDMEPVGSAYLSVTPVLNDVPTKADALTADDMTVYIKGENYEASYPYADLPEYIEVPVDSEIPYVISAENITVAESENLPDMWGQKRYAGVTEVLVEKMRDPNDSTQNYYYAKVECFVANTMVSVTFDKTIETYYSDFKVEAYTDKDRVLVFTPENATSAVGHFTAGKTLQYEFSGIFNIDGVAGSVLRTVQLNAAQHVILNFKMKNVEGAVGRPAIEVDYTCEDIYENMTVDPSDNGSFSK